jgi:hypothetical protein
MKNRSILITAVLLSLATLNYTNIVGKTEIRTVEFLSIWAIGALSGILIFLITRRFREKQ